MEHLNPVKTTRPGAIDPALADAICKFLTGSLKAKLTEGYGGPFLVDPDRFNAKDSLLNLIKKILRRDDARADVAVEGYLTDVASNIGENVPSISDVITEAFQIADRLRKSDPRPQHRK